MAVGLHLQISGPKATFNRTFARPPVIVGRAPPSQCLLEDSDVSKMHASFDLRDGMICCRDVGSLNGTYVGKEKLPPNRWVPLARADQRVEVQIGRWTIRASADSYVTPAPSFAGSSLAGMLDEVAAAACPPTPPTGTLAVPELQKNQIGGDARGIAHLAELCRAADSAMNTLYGAVVPILEAAPVASRPALCDHLARTYPYLAKDETFFALFRHYGWRPKHDAPAGPLGSAALVSLQELAKWYLGAERSFVTQEEIVAFKDRLRGALDELLLGYVPLVDGLTRFEREMDLRPGARSAPASAVDLARELLDWRKPSDGALQRMRASFADLMMHQVALLNGVMCGVKTLLTELAPAQIEKALQRKRGATFALFRLFSRPDPWPLYKERHSDLSDEENERFKLLFGPEFASEYQQFTRETRTVETEMLRPEARASREISPRLATR